MSSTSPRLDTGTPIRALTDADLAEARTIFRTAFGTFLGVPDPSTFWADREYIYTRWHGKLGTALAAERDGSLAGTNFLTHWGSFAFFGPLTVRPEFWDQRVAQALLGPTLDIFEQWGVRDAGLFTFSNSPKHVGLYQKFGFWPRFLTALMSKTVTPVESSYLKFSALPPARQTEAMTACRQLTDAIYGGLDPTVEIRSVHSQNLGDTVLLYGGDSLDAFAVCHCGEGSEAGAGACYIKFAAVRPGPSADQMFGRLLDACQSLAAEKGLAKLECGVNLNRSQAYRQMLQWGLRTFVQGVAMHRPDSPAYSRPDVYVIDDLR
jgi:GNAT superfamily N-acetyltransferase